MLSLLVSAALAFFARLRWLSLSFALSGLAVIASCWLALLALSWTGVWDQEMVSFGPGMPADRVVVFIKDPSEADINRFIEEVLSIPHPVRGYSFRPPLMSLLRVAVNGHIGLALQYGSQPNRSHVARLDEDIKGHPIVLRLFRDAVPREIVLQPD